MHKEGKMKGYFVSDGFMGYVDGQYLLFADESDYYDSFDQEESLK